MTVTLVGVATAVSIAAPAHADPITDNPITDSSFLSALTKAGIGYNDPAATTALGQSVCPMLVEPGKSFASVASSIGNQGISPQMASFFTGIAISMYCPQIMNGLGDGTLMSGLGNGTLLNFLQPFGR
jgi:Protein of unknown function (DUF732)